MGLADRLPARPTEGELAGEIPRLRQRRHNGVGTGPEQMTRPRARSAVGGNGAWDGGTLDQTLIGWRNRPSPRIEVRDRLFTGSLGQYGDIFILDRQTRTNENSVTLTGGKSRARAGAAYAN